MLAYAKLLTFKMFKLIKLYVLRKLKDISVFKLIILCTLCSLAIGGLASKVAMHYSKPLLKIKLLNSFQSYRLFSYKNLPLLLREVLSEKYRIAIDNSNYDMVFATPFGNEDINDPVIDKKAIKIFFTSEAKKPIIKNYDLSIGFNHINDPRYIRIPLYYQLEIAHKISINYVKYKDQGNCNPHKKEFACFLVSNSMQGNSPHNNEPLDGIAARNSIFHKLSEYKHVASGGAHLNNVGRKITGHETTMWLSQCKFVIAYENQSYDGYITEKLFQAYFNGAIPIYYSHQNSVKDINKKAIIYAGDFKDEDALVEYVKKVDSDDKLYCDIWNQNIIINPNQDYEVVKAKLRAKINPILEAKMKQKPSHY